MENPEEILQCLEEFSKIKPKDIPRELEEYLCFVAKTGNPVYQWPVIKCLFRQKLVNVISDFYETCPAVDIPPCLNVDLFNYNTMKTFILEKLDTFVAAPFTVQRICELLTTPRKQYNRIDKYMRALEKNILVVSTTEPVYRSAENGDNNNQAVVNGLEFDHLSSASSDETPNINIEEMDETPPHTPNWLPHTNRNTTTITLNTQQQSPTTLLGASTTSTSNEDDSLGDEPPGVKRHIVEAVLESQGKVSAVLVEESAGPDKPAADVSELLSGDREFGSGGLEEEGGSSDEDEEEERLLLGGEGIEKEENEAEQAKRDQKSSHIPSPIIVKRALTPTSDILAITHNTESCIEVPKTTVPTTVEQANQSDLAPADDQVSKTEIEVGSDDSLVVESGGGEMLVVETNERLVSVDEELKVDGKDGDSDNMSDKIIINPQVNIEYLKEINNQLPNTENIESMRKKQETVISTEATEIITANTMPEETKILTITDNVDINVKSQTEHVKLDNKTAENTETIDKEIEIEKHDTSAIVKEAEKLEKEVTQIENIPEVELVAKGAEEHRDNVEKIEEIVANIEEVANVENNENNVEQHERMEVDDDTLPDILEATSASL